MKYIVQDIVNKIISSTDLKKENETLFIVEGFSNIKIYSLVAQNLSEFFKKNGITYNIKLAKKRWEQFNREDPSSISLKYLESQKMLSKEESLTYYRNLHNSQVLILLGTEVEDDSTGSLDDIHKVSAEKYIDYLPKKKGKVQYSEVFLDALDNFSDNDILILNEIYHELFKLVPPDICKMSDQIDGWENRFTLFEELIELFYKDLPYWGIPTIKEGISDSKSKESRKKILNEAYKYFNQTYTKSDYSKNLTKIDAYLRDNGCYCDDWEGWHDQAITSLTSFKQVFSKYMMGERTLENKKKMLNTDFGVINKILKIRLAKEPKNKLDKEKKLTGNPILVFSEALLYSLKSLIVNADNAEISLDQIETLGFDFYSCEVVVRHFSGNAEEDLQEAWRKICLQVDGVIEYINNQNYSLLDNDLNITLSNPDFFSMTKINEIVKETKPSQELNKIDFRIVPLDKNGNEIDNLINKFEWIFSSNEIWLNSFYPLLDEKKLINESACIPLVTCNNFKNLIYSKSSEEFYDILADQTSFDFSFDFLSEAATGNNFHTNDFYEDFCTLGNSFLDFVHIMQHKGILKIFLERDKVYKFIDVYVKLAKKIKCTAFNEDQQYIIKYFLHAFNIEFNTDAIIKDRNTDYVMIPPWHPATLEKILHKYVFFEDGCKELWEKIQGNIDGFSNKDIEAELFNLDQLSMFQNGVDAFPQNNHMYLDCMNSYGGYSLYYSRDTHKEKTMRDYIKKEVVFDDSFNVNVFSKLDLDGQMFFDVLKKYINAFPNSYDNLKLTFIDPSDLQPIVAALHRYIEDFHKNNEEKQLYIQVKVLVRPENKGGQNYLAYWMDNYFNLDSNVKIKTFLNVWNNVDQLTRYLDSNSDIIFFMNILQSGEHDFTLLNENSLNNTLSLNECLFPIVLKPGINSITSKTRTIEITQPQFEASTQHMQVMYKLHNRDKIDISDQLFIQKIQISDENERVLDKIHEMAYWVVCIDNGIDGRIFRDNSKGTSTNIIGYSTGKGKFGQYTITITGRDSILASIKNRFSLRLNDTFKWGREKSDECTERCLKEATKLDGISVLSALNRKDSKMNEFMAYVLTSFKEDKRAKEEKSPLSVIIHLDSYQHWFNNSNIDKSVEDNSSSRPDFLLLKITDFSTKIKISATVIECKISLLHNKGKHVSDACKQVKHGLITLKQLFNPDSKSIKRRYWNAQLYRAMSYAQVSFSDSSSNFKEILPKLRAIIDGNYTIDWEGKIYGYWIDDSHEEEYEEVMDDIILNNIPQKCIKEYLTGNLVQDSYVNVEDVNWIKSIDEEILLDDEIIEESDKLENVFEKESIRYTSSFELEENVETKFKKISFENGKEISILNNKPGEVINESHTESCMDEGKNIKHELSDSILEDISGMVINDKKVIEDVRVLVGKDRANQEVYWEFGNKQLGNRHLLITGTSGQGKTYCIQCLLYELTKQNVSSIIFDYTEGFRTSQLEPWFQEKMEGKIEQKVVRFQGIPINPFKRYTLEFEGMTIDEKPHEVASRFANILKHVYKLGDQQFAAVYDSVLNGFKKYGDKMNVMHFQEELDNLISVNSSAKSVKTKLTQFFHSELFTTDTDFNWENILYSEDAQSTVIQLTQLDRDLQVIITEIMLWDCWHYTKSRGSKDRPFVAVLDEAQNLSLNENSPSKLILTEGRKFGWSAWYATQSLKVLDDQEIIYLMQSATKIYFKPTDEEIPKTSKLIDSSAGNTWVQPLKALTKGKCIYVGDRIIKGKFGSSKPTITLITALEERE